MVTRSGGGSWAMFAGLLTLVLGGPLVGGFVAAGVGSVVILAGAFVFFSENPDS